MQWTREHARRVILDFAFRLKGVSYTGNHNLYKEGQDLSHDLGLSSLEAMDLAAQVNAFFHLMETGPDQYLLNSPSVDIWAEKCVNGRKLKNEQLTFFTSGTTGQSKPITHQQAFIDRETDFLSQFFEGISAIISLVPSASIYGYLYTIALPQALGIPLIYPSQVNWANLSGNTLIVGTPFTWSHLIRSMPFMSVQARGVSSTAPLSGSLFEAISSKGIKLSEIYGSTETAGIGWRKKANEAYQLFPYWALTENDSVRDKDNQGVHTLMDKIKAVSPNTFTLLSRQDHKVKVAGKLVDLNRLTQQIEAMEGVAQCKLSAKKTVDRTLIMANVTLSQNTQASQEAFTAQVKANFEPAEQPTEISFDEA